MSHESISLAAQQLLADSEGTVLYGMNEIISWIPAKYDTTYSRQYVFRNRFFL
jgi:hypothetical protein